MYNLLELYSTMPVTKTVHRQSITPISMSEGGNAGILLKRPKKDPELGEEYGQDQFTPATPVPPAAPIEGQTPGPKKTKRSVFC